MASKYICTGSYAAALAAGIIGFSSGAYADVAPHLEVVSGDRQIAVNTTTPPKAYQVRALDSNGAPLPGATVFIGTVYFPGGIGLVDEFGFRGFNASGWQTIFALPPEYLTVTDANGIASLQGPYRDTAPSGFVVTAAIISGPGVSGNAGQRHFSAIIAETAPPGRPAVVVEYFNTQTSHYFNTLTQVEIDLLDAGRFSGWRRSIGSFLAYESEQNAPQGAVPVCRFFSSQYTSHFYTADHDECQTVIDRWSDVWVLETRTGFYIFEPDKVTGQCATGQIPVYRLYNTRGGPNHRYITDRRLRDRMVEAGWVAEGYGPDSVMLCTPR